MGIVGRFFNASADGEEKMVEHYTSLFQLSMGMSHKEAKENVKGLVKRAKKESKRNGTWNLPQNCGDILLIKEKDDERVKADLAKKRKEGVTDNDIRWWWNRHDIERMLIMNVDEIFHMELYVRCQEEESMNEDDAGKEVRRQFPMYGDTDDTTVVSGADRPLPHELKDRISKYLERRKQTSVDIYKSEAANVSSFNAFVRREIKTGKI